VVKPNHKLVTLWKGAWELQSEGGSDSAYVRLCVRVIVCLIVCASALLPL
jgi:hypothetical protein